MIRSDKEVYEVIVIGAGPGGLMASWILSLSNVPYITFGFVEDSAAYFMRFPWDVPFTFEGETDINIVDRMYSTLQMLGERIQKKMVVGIYNEHPDIFTVIDEEGMTWMTRRIVLFPGVERSYVKIKNEELVSYTGLFYDYCNVPSYQREGRVGLIGPSEMITKYAKRFFFNSKEIIIFCIDDRLSGDHDSIETIRMHPRVTIFEGVVPVAINKIEDDLYGFTFKSAIYNTEYTIFLKLLVTYPLILPAVPYLLNLGVKYDGPYIIVDENYETTVPGIYAGGDAIGGRMTVLKALQDAVNIGYNILDQVYQETPMRITFGPWREIGPDRIVDRFDKFAPERDNSLSLFVKESALMKKYFDAYVPGYDYLGGILKLMLKGKIIAYVREVDVDNLRIIPQMAKLSVYLKDWDIEVRVVGYKDFLFPMEGKPPDIHYQLPAIKVFDENDKLLGTIVKTFKFGRPERDIYVMCEGKYNDPIYTEIFYKNLYSQIIEDGLGEY